MSPDQLKTRLSEFFPDAEIMVNDTTGSEDHYDVYVRSPIFKDLSRIDAHQRVMSAVRAELKSGEVHALSIRTQV